jgi:chitin disaccharide deacetylase
MTDQRDDNQPMHRRGSATDGDEPSDVAALRVSPQAVATNERLRAHGMPEHSQRRAICITIDDFGLHAGINQAALELATMGHAQAIGCMVGGPAWPTGSPALRQLDAQQVDLGLHFDLTELPLLPRSVRSLPSLIRDSFLRRLDRRAVRAEIRAQLDAFEALVGRGPAYVDGHQHVHQLPIVRSELLAELAERYGSSKPWLRSTRRPRESRQALRERVKPWLIEQLGAGALATMARRMGYPQNGHLLGVYDFHGGAQQYRQRLAAWLAAARDGDLLMCHPSLAVPCDDGLIEARHAEYQVLSDPLFARQLREAGIEMQPMSRILG